MKALAHTVFLVLAIVQLGLAGCAVTVPVKAEPEIIRQDNPDAVVNTLVTVGPRRLLEILTKLISEAAPKVEPVDALLFRDAAFPLGGWRLHDLLDPDNRSRIVRDLQIDYLVLVSPLVYTVGGEDGFFVPLVAGAQSAEHKSSLSATIYDLNSGSPLCRFDVTAKGDEVVLYYVVIFTGTTPHVVTPTLEAMGNEIAKTIGSVAAKDRVRIAVLAAEVTPPGK